MGRRAIFTVVFLLSVLFLPLYVHIVLALGGMFYFSWYGEAVLLFFLSDLLYGTRVNGILDIVFMSFLISLVELISIEFIKTKLTFYQK